MTTFITWQNKDDTAFRSLFEDLTGIKVQEHPLQNAEQTHKAIGVQLDPVLCDYLEANEWLEITKDSLPDWWQPYMEEIVE